MCELTKKCTLCKEEKELKYFYKDSSKKDGLNTRCKLCKETRENLNNIIGIYKITSPTGKVYIGQSRNIIKRRQTYEILPDKIKTQVKLYNSLKKYGWEVHTFEIIEECEITDLKCKERYWQDYYDVLGKNGLNCILQECDDMPRIISEETREKISKGNFGKKRLLSEKGLLGLQKAHKGKIMSEESRQKLSDSLKAFYEENESKMIGFKHSDEAKAKMSLAHTGKILTEEHKSKIGRKGELNKNFGKVMSEEQKEKLRGERLHCQGENNPLYGVPLSDEHKLKISEKALQRYEERPELKIALSERMSGENHRQWGVPIGEYQKSRIKEKNSKIVLNIQTGIFYNSAKEVSEIFDINYSTLRYWLNTEGKNKSDFIYC